MTLKKFISAFFFLLPAAIHTPASRAAGDAVTAMISVSVDSGRIHEDCRPMTAGQDVAFTYAASAPLDFNVHYHEGVGIFYIAQESMSLSSGGTFASPVTAEICLMWTNAMHRNAVTLDYKVE